VATKFFPSAPVTSSVRRRAAASARRLGIPRIDLYQIHQTARTAAFGGAMRAVHHLQQEGLIAEVGVSNGTLDRWSAAEDALGGRVLSNQVPYSLVNRAAEQSLLPYARSQGRVVIAYSPLARGLLSGRYDRERRPASPAQLADSSPENLMSSGLLDTLRGRRRPQAAAQSRSPGSSAPVDTAIRAKPRSNNSRANIAAAGIDLTDDEYELRRHRRVQFVGRRRIDQVLAVAAAGSTERRPGAAAVVKSAAVYQARAA
jgi:aryl-alcohol dehydrogenase-like predicted oxidoreductase